MLKKNNIRSIRFSDEMMEIINQQAGDNFSQKFERLVYNCYMLSSEKEKEIQRLDKQIAEKRDQLVELRAKCSDMDGLLSGIRYRLNAVYDFLGDAM